MSDNLSIVRMTEDQTGKELTHNEALGHIDALLSSALTVDLTSGDVTLTTTEFKNYLAYRADNQPDDTRVVTIQAIPRFFLFNNSGAFDVTVTLGTTDVVIEPGYWVLFYTDGTANGLFAAGSQLGGGGSGGSFAVVSNETASYTLAVDDEYVRVANASAVSVTVDPVASVAWTVGQQITVVQSGAGQVTIVAGSGVTINTPETLKLRKQYSAVTLTYVAADTWDLIGDLEVLP